MTSYSFSRRNTWLQQQAARSKSRARLLACCTCGSPQAIGRGTPSCPLPLLSAAHRRRPGSALTATAYSAMCCTVPHACAAHRTAHCTRTPVPHIAPRTCTPARSSRQSPQLCRHQARVSPAGRAQQAQQGTQHGTAGHSRLTQVSFLNCGHQAHCHLSRAQHGTAGTAGQSPQACRHQSRGSPAGQAGPDRGRQGTAGSHWHIALAHRTSTGFKGLLADSSNPIALSPKAALHLTAALRLSSPQPP